MYKNGGSFFPVGTFWILYFGSFYLAYWSMLHTFFALKKEAWGLDPLDPLFWI